MMRVDGEGRHDSGEEDGGGGERGIDSEGGGETGKGRQPREGRRGVMQVPS